LKQIFLVAAISTVVILLVSVGVVYFQNTDKPETPEMVQNLVSKAIQLYNEKGTDAFEIINNSPEFHGKQLYVYVFGDDDGLIVAHGVDTSLIGTNIDDLVDVNGVNIGKDVIHDSATKDGAWVTYFWEDPETQKILPKAAWLVSHDGYVFGSGIYGTTDVSYDHTLIGSDRDEHGCIPSAGYSWSEENQECVRPWEENASLIGTLD